MLNKKTIEVSFIIIEYHSINDVLKCAEAIKNRCSNIIYEIIISSNSLYDNSMQQKLLLENSFIKWRFNEKNNGFAYGMNCGISIAVGEFIILQNPDTLLENDKLIEVLNLMKEDKTIGLIGPKIINNKGEVQDSTRRFMTPKILINRLLHRVIYKKSSILDKNINYNVTQKVNWVIGAYMITSREAIKVVGLLDEKFFMYVEDMDWCLRFWEKNLEVIYYPDLIIKYEGDRKSTKGNLLKANKYTLFHIKNYLSFLKQHGYKKIKKLSELSYDYTSRTA